jgi:hypothetical protein
VDDTQLWTVLWIKPAVATVTVLWIKPAAPEGGDGFMDKTRRTGGW